MSPEQHEVLVLDEKDIYFSQNGLRPSIPRVKRLAFLCPGSVMYINILYYIIMYMNT